jgi:hypothetical protein
LIGRFRTRFEVRVLHVCLNNETLDSEQLVSVASIHHLAGLHLHQIIAWYEIETAFGRGGIVDVFVVPKSHCLFL